MDAGLDVRFVFGLVGPSVGAGLDVRFVFGFVVSTVGAAAILVSDVVLLMFCFVVCSAAREVSGRTSAFLVTPVSTLTPFTRTNRKTNDAK